MPVLRRRADNLVQLLSFGGVALLVLVVRHDLLSVVLGVPLCILAVRTGRAGVYLRPDELVVRNTFRTFRMPWDDVDRVDVGRAGRPSLPCVVVRTTSGQAVPLWCLQPSTRGRKGESKQVRVLQEVQQAVRTVKREAP